MKNRRYKILISIFLLFFLLAPAAASASFCCVCVEQPADLNQSGFNYNWEGGSVFTSITSDDNKQCSKDQKEKIMMSGMTPFICALKDIERCGPPKVNEEVGKFKFQSVIFGITIPSLHFSAPPAATDEEGNIYIPWLAEYIKAVYNYSVVVISVLAVVVIIIQGGVIIASAGGPAKQQAYKRISQAIIGLLLAWESYAVLYAINANLTIFKPLKIQFIEKIPIIDLVEEPETSLPDEGIPGTPPSGQAPSKVPDFKQFDKKWAAKVFGPPGSTVCQCGSKSAPKIHYKFCNIKTSECCTNMQASACGPTSLAMVLSSYGAAGAMPDKVADFVGLPGNGRICNKGTGMGAAIDKLKQSPWPDFSGRMVNKSEALKLLAEKRPIIILCTGCSGTTRSGGMNHWGGHYMVLTSMDSSGNIYVNDPGANNRSAIYIMTTSQIEKNGGLWYVYK